MTDNDWDAALRWLRALLGERVAFAATGNTAGVPPLIFLRGTLREREYTSSASGEVRMLGFDELDGDTGFILHRNRFTDCRALGPKLVIFTEDGVFHVWRDGDTVWPGVDV